MRPGGWWGCSEGLSEAGEGAWFPGQLFPQGPAPTGGSGGPIPTFHGTLYPTHEHGPGQGSLG